jgi:hypothetical protein
MGLTIGICAGIAASNLSITQDNSEGSADERPARDVAQFEFLSLSFMRY